MSNVIEVKELNKTIKKHHILKDINFSIKSGKIVGFVGRNGSGKSMLFKTLCGLIVPSSGNVTVNGVDIFKKGVFPKNLGALIEYPGFLAQYSGLTNLTLLADIQKKVVKAEIKEAMNIVGLDPEDRRPYRKYSLGMRQKLGLAAAIMEKPEIIVLDEPTNNLDEDSVIEFRELLNKLRDEGNVTILLASHNKNDIENCCDYVYTIKNGVLPQENEVM